MGLFSGIASIAAPLVGGLLGGASSGGDMTQTQVTDLPEWLKPYYTGGADGLTGMVPGQPPINQDFLYWNQMAGMGYPIGPPPPLYTDNPGYTGENVFSPPGTFLQPMNNMALYSNPMFGGGLLGGGQGQGPAGPGGGGPGGGILQYPSQQTPSAPPIQGGMTDPVTTAPQGLSELDKMKMQMMYRQMARGRDPETGIGPPTTFTSRDLSPEGQAYWAGLDPREKRQRARNLGWR